MPSVPLDLHDCPRLLVSRGEDADAPRPEFLLTEGKVVVVCEPVRDDFKGLALSGSWSEELMADQGYVAAVGKDVDLDVGDRVVVFPKHGKSIEDYTTVSGRVQFTRFFGCAGGFSPYKYRGDKRYPPTLVPWWHSIPLIIKDMEASEFQPTGDWVLLRHVLENETDTGILLSDSAFIDPRATCTAEIVALGPLCKEITDLPEPGNQFYYWEGAAKHVLGLDRDYVLVREPFVLGQRL